MRLARFCLAPVPMILIAAPLAAQEVPEQAAEPAEVIVVTGAGLESPPGTPAYSQTVIARDQIETAPSGRIEDVLGGVAGFAQFRRSDSRSSNPSAQGVTLRALGGNASSRAQMLLDGMPMADPFFGYIPLTAIAPERLGAIRVTRGGGSGPFGAGALAGTIELESAGIDSLAPVAASALVNDRGETEISGGLAQRLGRGFLTADARWDRGQGFFTTPEDQRVPATARARFDSWSANLRMVAPVGDSVELQARTLVFRDRRTLRFDGADSTSEGQDASLRLVGRGNWQFDVLAYIQARNFTNIVVSSTRFVPVLNQKDTPSTGIGGKFELRPPVGDAHVLRLGLDYRRSSGELQEDAISAFTGRITEQRRAGGTNADLGLFMEDDWALGNWVLTAGLRADRSVVADGFYRAVDANGLLLSETRAPDRSDWSVGYRAGIAWMPAQSVRLRAATYRGLRQPTLNELYRPFVVFPVVTQANADLQNEELVGYEAGADFTPANGVALSITAFDNRVDNAIANVTIAPNLRQRRNLPAIEAQGLEAGLALSHGPVSLNATLAWTDARVRGEGASLALDGMRPAQTPELMASATLDWEPAEGWKLAATLRHTGSQFEDDLQSNVLPAVTTLGVFAQVPLRGQLALVLRGENLTDATIVTRNADGSMDLGIPRTVWAGLRFSY